MKSAFEAAEQYFEEAAAVMNLTSSMRDLLLIPEREVKVQVPIKRDNGEIATSNRICQHCFASATIGAAVALLVERLMLGE